MVGHERLDGSLMVKLGTMTQAHPPVACAPITARAGGIEIDLSGREGEDVLKRIFRALKATS